MPWNDDRPMSPHLQIYRLPLTAKLSILHRMTGAFLFFGMALLVIVLLALSMGETHWRIIHALLNHWIGILFLTALTFSLYYHLCHGLRHLLWDTGLQMAKQQLLKAGIIAIAISLILTISTWLTAWYYW